jgi:magnesium transporter
VLGDLVPTNVVLQTLSNPRKNLRFYDDDKEQIEDIILTAGQLIDSIKGSLKTIVNIREAYSNIATNNLNRQIKLLTTLTVVLTIPTIVGSFFGMNVPVPFHSNPLAFIGIIAATSGIAALIIYLFKKSGWL